MFERNKVDNARTMGAVGAELTLADGRVLTGRLAVPISLTLGDMLNGSAQFLEFETYEGEPLLIAKAALASARPLAPPRTPALGGDLRDLDGFDPWQVLGLKCGASASEVRAAYHKLALSYHPDRYAAAELPAEVSNYLSIMARRVNAAFAALTSSIRDASQRPTAARAAPVYASPPRG